MKILGIMAKIRQKSESCTSKVALGIDNRTQETNKRIARLCARKAKFGTVANGVVYFGGGEV